MRGRHVGRMEVGSFGTLIAALDSNNKNNTEPNLFILDSEELRLVQTKPYKNKLPFALMIKFFQLENRYPSNDNVISPELVGFLVNQLGINEKLIEKFDWENRNSERYRQEIREFLGYKQATLADSEKLVTWLMEYVLPQAFTSVNSYFFHTNSIV